MFIAWLNLDFGFDVCFIYGFDAYIKTWFQLAFPVYIISLVIIVIIVSEYSPRFAALIGKRDPVATLATLILLSYTKLLSVTITALTSADISYPDGSQETVWLPDGNVKYFRGKHAALVIVALLIILIGVPYTILLFFWQWVVRAPRWKVFKWTRNTRLHAFIAVYHVPYNSQYRYWTGLLLLVRVILYCNTVASATASTNPRASLSATVALVGGLFILKCIMNLKVYKKSILSIIENATYFNLLAIAAFSLYDINANVTKKMVIAHISTITTFLLLVGVIVYHIYLLMTRKKKSKKEENVIELSLVQPNLSVPPNVTYSEIGFPNHKSTPSEACADKAVANL